MNNRNKDKGGTAYWIIAAVLMLSGAWPIAVPMILYKLFGPDKGERRQAPPLNPGVTQANRTNISTYYPNARGHAAVNTNPVRSGEYSANQSTVSQTARSMARTPDGSKKSIGMLFGFGFFLAFIGMAGMSDVFQYFDFSEFMFSFSFLTCGLSMVAGGLNLKSAGSRYKKYMNIIGSSQAVEIKSLAKKMGLKEKRVVKDLEKMCEKGYFGAAAYVNMELGYLFLSSEADDEISRYREQAAQKQAKAKQQKAQNEKMEIAEGYQKILRQIRDVNDRIAHEEMTRKIYIIEDVTRNIFTAVQNDPEKRGMIDNFLGYYLPTTLKLLESYAKLEHSGVDGANIAQSKKSIEDAMDSIVTGFENQYDELYKRDVLDIETDIDVMTSMLKQQKHTAADDFRIEAEKTKTADTRSQFEKDFGLQHAGGTATVSYGGSAAAVQQEKK